MESVETVAEQPERAKTFRDLIEKSLRDIEYTPVDDLRYSFNFNGDEFVFRLPTVAERHVIQLMLANTAKIAKVSKASMQSQMESEHWLTLCSSIAMTRLEVLLDKAPPAYHPVTYFIDKDFFDFGFFVYAAEAEFVSAKKKQLSIRQ